MSSMFGNMGSKLSRGSTGNSSSSRMRSGGGSSGDIIPKGHLEGQLQQFTPEQMQLFQQMFAHVSPESQTGRLASGDQSMFGEIEAPALRQFQELQGQMGSRFSGMGMGAQKSSGFQNTMGQMGSDFAMQLQAQRQQLQRQAIQDLMGNASTLLGQSPYERFLIEKQQKQQQSSGWGQAIGAGLGGIGGFFAGGPSGAMAGAQLGGQIGSSF